MTQEIELPDTGMREVVIDSIDSCTQLMMAMAQGDKFRLVSVSNAGLTGNQRRLTFMRKDIGDPTTVAVPVEVIGRVHWIVADMDRYLKFSTTTYIGHGSIGHDQIHEAAELLQPYTKGE